MELKELGAKLLLLSREVNPEPGRADEWNALVSAAFDAIDSSHDVNELATFFRMGFDDFPEEITTSTLERMMHLGDLSKETLRAYVFQLDLYFIKHGLRAWLFTELQRLEAAGGNAEDYRQIGQEVLRRLSVGDVDG